MRKITYASESFVTSDEVADALVIFTTALAQSGTSDAVSLPVIDGDGRPAVVDLVVGPASEMISVPADVSEGPGLMVGTAVEELVARAAEVRLRHGSTLEGAPQALPLQEDLPEVDGLPI
jgi:hypothetical protein